MQQALDTALRLLSYRPRSEAEVRGRLARRFSDEDIDKTIAHLKSGGLIDDHAFASYWRRGREANRPRSAYMVHLELRKKGVSREVVEGALAGYDDEANAYKAASKIVSRIGGLDRTEFNRKLSSYLARRGFGRGVVRKVTQQVWYELADPADGHVEGDAQH